MNGRARFLLLFLLMVASYRPAKAADWMEPTPEQLKMTSDPAAPGAAAVYLFREETVDDEHHFHSVYAVIKILSEKGKEEFSDVAIPEYLAGQTDIAGVEGQTIEPDGTVVPFAGKPFDKEVVKFGGVKVMQKVFTMPNAQVGSILEYRWELTYGPHTVVPPDWEIQQPIFVHKAHYHYVPSGTAVNYFTTHDAQGHAATASRMLYYHWLPQDAKVQVTRGGDGDMTSYDMTVENITPVPDEEYTPPLESFSYRVAFYYSPEENAPDFWKQEGAYWSKDVDRRADASDAIRAAVAQIVSPGDSDEAKIEKIYAAAMTVENTRFTREHSAEENKAEGEKTRTAADIWQDKRGTPNQITELFLAMARAAGFKAYAMITTRRDRNMLNVGYLYWRQLTDELAIVNVGGKEEYFDPGERYCEFGKLAWVHTQMLGIRQTDSGTEEATAPAGSYTDNETFRRASLTLGSDGTVRGEIQITMKGAEALKWRQRALRDDEVSAKGGFRKALQARVPDGVQLKMEGFEGLTDPTQNLVATLEVSGTMGTAAGKRTILPAEFFEANVKPPFAAEERENPIDMEYPYAEQDQVTVTLGPGLKVESLPQGKTIPMAKGGEYKTVYGPTASGYEAVRLMALGNTIYKQDEYGMLRGFFQSAAAQDQEPVVVKR